MATVQFGVLGPVEARIGDQQLPIGGPKRRALLALLLLQHNRVVSTERIIEALWEDDPPSSVRTQVHALISALRREIGAADESVIIETRQPGYALRVEPNHVDLGMFEGRVTEARAAACAGDLSAAADTYREALQLWRGAALDGADAPFVVHEAARLEEHRFVALEERIEADLGLGRHGLLVAELTSLVAEHPLREGLRASLMLALHRSGRRAEALQVYRAGREHLVEDHGLDPGRRLRELEQAILRDDPSLHLHTEDLPGVDAPHPPSATVTADPHGSVTAASRPPVPVSDVPTQRRERVGLTVARRFGVVSTALVTAVVLGLVAAGMARGRADPEAEPGVRGQPQPTAAAPGCSERVQRVTDYRGRPFPRIWSCSMRMASQVYANPQDLAPLQPVSFMAVSQDVWVICQVNGRLNPTLGGHTSTWWLYTQGDSVNRPNDYGYTNAWAFLPAAAVTQSRPDRPVQGVPECDRDFVVPGRPTVSSAAEAAAGSPGDRGAARAGVFVFTPAPGTADVAGFLYFLDRDAKETFLASSGPATVRVRAPGRGPHTLYVRVKDRAGNLSPARTHAFTVVSGS